MKTNFFVKRAALAELVDLAKWRMLQHHPGDSEHREAKMEFKMAVERYNNLNGKTKTQKSEV